MSAFTLKIIALVTMLLDHCGALYEGWFYKEWFNLREIGRISFPLFTFCMINSWGKTGNKEKYLQRIMFSALVSQIPFTLAFNMVNQMKLNQTEKLNVFLCSGAIHLVMIALLVILYVYHERKIDASFWCFLGCLLIRPFAIKINGIWILSDTLNIFYNYMAGLLTIDAIEKNRLRSQKGIVDKVLLCLWIIVLHIYIVMDSDYGFAGVILMYGLFLLREKKELQMLMIAIWSIGFYGVIIGNRDNAIYACLSTIFVFLYNGKKGRSMKYFFYVFYPTHLLFLGILNIIHRIN